MATPLWTIDECNEHIARLKATLLNISSLGHTISPTNGTSRSKQQLSRADVQKELQQWQKRRAALEDGVSAGGNRGVRVSKAGFNQINGSGPRGWETRRP